MTRNNTGNPIGSTDYRDLQDNMQIADEFTNSATGQVVDRLGVTRRTIAGMESAFDSRMASLGYDISLGDYGAGKTITDRGQVVLRDGEYYKAAASATLPIVLTGTWGTDSEKLVAVGDAALRQELAGDSGASRVGYIPGGTGAVATNVQAKLREIVSATEYESEAEALAATSRPVMKTNGVFGGTYYAPDRRSAHIRPMYGVIRNSGSGWDFINDDGHVLAGFSGTCEVLAAPEDFKLRLPYQFYGSKVGNVVAVPDETFASFGIITGASVGLDEAVLRASMPLRFRTFGTGAVGDVSTFFGSRVSIAPLANGTGFLATVPALQNGGANPAPQVSVQHSDPRSDNVRVQYVSQTTFNVVAYRTLSGLVQWSSGTTFSVTSDNVCNLSAAWDAGTSTLTISHDTCGYSNLQAIVTHMDGSHEPRVSAANATSFSVRFYDNSGVLQTSLSSAFKFRFMRPQEFPAAMQSTQRCYIDCGRALLYWGDIVSANGNIWLAGDIEA